MHRHCISCQQPVPRALRDDQVRKCNFWLRFSSAPGFSTRSPISCAIENPLTGFWGHFSVPYSPTVHTVPADVASNLWLPLFLPHSDCLTCYSDLAAQGHTVETFGRYLWASSILAAEADVSKMIFPPLTQALSLARLQSRTALHAAVHRQSEERHECGRGRGEWQRLEHLRESVPHTAARKTKSKFCDEQGLEQKQEQDQGREELWAPPLAVLRVVDALFHDGGRPRMSFVRFNCS